MDENRHLINSLGEICPIPLLKAQKQYKEMGKNESFTIVTDHSCVVSSIKDYFAHCCCTITIDEVLNGVWEIHIKK